MSEHTTAVLPAMTYTIIATAAYLIACLYIGKVLARQTSFIPAPGTGTIRHDYRAYLAVFTALLSFACAPLGALPALVPDNAALIAMGAVGISLVCDARVPLAIKQHQGISLFLLVVVLFRLAAYATAQGVPGAAFSLDTYVATPLLGISQNASLAGVLLLALAAFPPHISHTSPLTATRALAYTLRQLFFLACWICFFIPANIASHTACGPLIRFLLDACYFWLKIYMAYIVACLLGNAIASHAGRWHLLRVACIVLGMTLL